jgi:VanZ family protein
MLSLLMRGAAWALIILICVLSLVPPVQRPTTVSHGLEHLGIFFMTGVAFGLGYRRRHFAQAMALIAFAGAIEIAQFLSPGRHPRLSDFLIDAIGACSGIVVASIVNKFIGVVHSCRDWGRRPSEANRGEDR